MTGRRRHVRAGVARRVAIAGIVMSAAVVSAGCGSALVPTSRSSVEPSGSAPTASKAGSPSSRPQPSQPALRFVPGNDLPLEEAMVRGLTSTPTGYAVRGDVQVPGDRVPFLVSGSEDARTWVRQDADPARPAFIAIAGGPRGWIATSDDRSGPERPTTQWFSADGLGWERVPDQGPLASASIDADETDPLSAGPAGFAAVGQALVGDSTLSAVWTSPDGRSWTEAQALRDGNIDRVLVVPAGFLAVPSDCCTGDPLRFSADGITWRVVSGGAASPDAPDRGRMMIAALGATLVVVAVGSDGQLQTFTASIAELSGGPLAWRHDAASDAVFAGSGASAMTASADTVLVLGFDRASLDPIAWTSRDGLTWARTALDPATFGGGVPGIAAASGSASGSSFAALGFRANDAGAVRSQLWRSDDGAEWAPAGGDVLGVLPSPATAACPATAPTEVTDFLVMDPAQWPTCFGSRALTVRGIVGSCDCGGTTDQVARPPWLLDPLGLPTFEVVPPVTAAATGGGAFGVMIDPAHPVPVPPVGALVEMTGHFADAASDTCRVFPADGAMGPVAPRAVTVALCRRAFVVTAIHRLPG